MIIIWQILSIQLDVHPILRLMLHRHRRVCCSKPINVKQSSTKRTRAPVTHKLTTGVNTQTKNKVNAIPYLLLTRQFKVDSRSSPHGFGNHERTPSVLLAGRGTAMQEGCTTSTAYFERGGASASGLFCRWKNNSESIRLWLAILMCWSARCRKNRKDLAQDRVRRCVQKRPQYISLSGGEWPSGRQWAWLSRVSCMPDRAKPMG